MRRNSQKVLGGVVRASGKRLSFVTRRPMTTAAVESKPIDPWAVGMGMVLGGGLVTFLSQEDPVPETKAPEHVLDVVPESPMEEGMKLGGTIGPQDWTTKGAVHSMFKTSRILGEGSTGCVVLAEALEDLDMCDPNPTEHTWRQQASSDVKLRVFVPIKKGQKVAVKIQSIEAGTIGSFSGGAAPQNYPRNFVSVCRERTCGARLAAGTGPGKSNIVHLLATWLDSEGIVQVYDLVDDASDLHDLIAPENDSTRIPFISKPLPEMARMFRDMAMGVAFSARCGLVWRDGGLQNWMVSGALKEKGARPVMIDFGLAVMTDNPITDADTFMSMEKHMRDVESPLGFGTGDHAPNAEVTWPHIFSKFDGYPQHSTDPERVQPIDMFYTPGAASPKYVCPPEARVLRDEVASGSELHTKLRSVTKSPYTPAYDVWVLAWTYIQMISGERFIDYKALTKDPNDPMGSLLKKFFFDKKLQVPVEWEVKGPNVPPMYKLALMNTDDATFRKEFLHPFFDVLSDRLRAKGKLTPAQEELCKPDGKFRPILEKMLEFDPAARETYLASGALEKAMNSLC